MTLARGRIPWLAGHPRLAGIVAAALALACGAASARAQAPGAAPPPTLAEVRAGMGIPSREYDLRGQRDTVGFASRADQMARVWELSGSPPAPDSLGRPPAPGVAAILAPHDDYLYAGRVYRRVIPLVTARHVVLVGVFHGYRRFGTRDRVVLEPYVAWRAPDGPIPVSGLRNDLLERLDPSDFVVDAGMHDAEHSIEALAYWLRHLRPDLQIVPIVVPAASFERFETLADRVAGALHAAMRARGWRLGRDVAIAISADAVHYGPDFRHVPFGDGGVEAYRRAVKRDRALLAGPLSGPVTGAGARRLFETFVDPSHPDDYRLTWCGRFSIPFGLLLLERLARAEDARAVGHPLAYATSVGWPELPVRDTGLGATAPANLYHFVGYPAVAFTLEPAAGRPREAGTPR
jgi:AmmeMemoRadiSam system protein B